MHTERPHATCFALTLLGAFLAGTGAAMAEQYCFPHCNYVRYYGPFDLSYIRLGLIGYLQSWEHFTVR